ncbi:MAG: hypothetical protein Kow00120_11020 [Anaerolineae bacterium]
MWTPHPSAAGNERAQGFVMGLGWFLVERHGQTFAGHNGDIVGFSSAFAHFLDNRMTVVLFCNVGGINSPHEVAFRIAALFDPTLDA